jgi:hypothetical protein
MKLEKLKPGMTVYDVHRYKMGNTNMSSVGVWSVYIIDIDNEKQIVTASWNGNTPKKFYRNDWLKWKFKKPVLVTGFFGSKRVAKRGEVMK